jgi:D-glycero-D-manno-heptose 1,7-bisphosphate phosphatase
MERAVFIDKDGTLIKNVPYNTDPGLVELEKGAGEALAAMHRAAYKLIIISNQPGIALGYFEEAALETVYLQIQALLRPYALQLDGFYYCPHHVSGTRHPFNIACNCRKPAPGLLLKAADDFDIHLPDSWMIGDILDDVEAGNQAGCRSILINNGNETEWTVSTSRTPDYVATDMEQAATIICSNHKSCYE